MIRFVSLVTLVLINLFILLFFLDFTGVLHVYSRVKESLKPNKYATTDVVPTNSREQDILYNQQLEATMAALKLRESDIKKEGSELEKLKQDMEVKQRNLDEEENNLKNRVKEMDKKQAEREDYDNKLQSLAQNYFNMPPQNAAERILALNDDLLIIDTLDAINKYAASINTPSTVPYLISLMPPEASGRILRKLATPD